MGEGEKPALGGEGRPASTHHLHGTRPTCPAHAASRPFGTPPKLLDQLREALRARHFSRRTEATYCQWVRRYIFFHNIRYAAYHEFSQERL
jgi:hypothetical protein